MPYVTTWERRAREEGLQEGVTLGREEGVTLGREKGMIEEKTEIARRMLCEGISLDIICKTTGLSRSEVESLELKQPVH